MAEGHIPGDDGSTLIVSDPDTDDEAIPEIERFYFFTVSNHNNSNQATSKVSRNIPQKKVTFAHVRHRLEEGSFPYDFNFMLKNTACVLTIRQEGMEKWGVLKHGYYASGAGTYEDPYQVYIHEREASVSFH